MRRARIRPASDVPLDVVARADAKFDALRARVAARVELSVAIERERTRIAVRGVLAWLDVMHDRNARLIATRFLALRIKFTPTESEPPTP
jgi:hypothetical protein